MGRKKASELTPAQQARNAVLDPEKCKSKQVWEEYIDQIAEEQRWVILDEVTNVLVKILEHQCAAFASNIEAENWAATAPYLCQVVRCVLTLLLDINTTKEQTTKLLNNLGGLVNALQRAHPQDVNRLRLSEVCNFLQADIQAIMA